MHRHPKGRTGEGEVEADIERYTEVGRRAGLEGRRADIHADE